MTRQELFSLQFADSCNLRRHRCKFGLGTRQIYIALSARFSLSPPLPRFRQPCKTPARQVVILAADYSIEPFDRFLKRHVLAFLSGEYLGNVEGLR